MDSLKAEFDLEVFKCPWRDCDHQEKEFAYFFSHCSRTHVQTYVDLNTTCSWGSCQETHFQSPNAFFIHVSIHVYYHQLMHKGYNVLLTTNSSKSICHLERSQREDISGFPRSEFVCAWKDCNAQFSDYNMFVEHTGIHAIEDVTIPVMAKEKLRKIRYAQCCWLNCSKNFKTKSQLKYHILAHSFGKNFACPFCGMGFISRSQLLNHCYRQNYSVGLKSNLKRKKMEQDDEELGQEMSIDIDAQNQTLESQETDENAKITCKYCPLKFPTRQLAQDHLSIIHERNYRCTECDFTAPYPSNLKSHIKYKHSKEREFKCEICSVGFKSSSDLMRHTSLHSTIICLNSCDICGKTYTTPYTLKRHKVEKHAGIVLLFECEVCKTKFPTLESLTEHLRKEHTYYLVQI